MNEILPAQGASGMWRLKAPFDTKISTGIAYTCRAVRKLGETVLSGIDAYEEYYGRYDIPRTVYEEHLAADISVVTLMSSAGSPLHVPSPYLNGWPSGDVVPYVVVGLICNLGALPNTVDPSFLKEKIDNVIKASLGHDPEVDFVTLSEVTNKPWVEHVAMESARLSMITDDNTDYTRRVKAEAALTAAQVQIAALQKYIVDHKLVP